MSLQEYIEKMKIIQQHLLDFLDNENNEEVTIQNFVNFIQDQKIVDNHYDLKILLYLIAKISKNHYRCQYFFEKLEKIFLIFKGEIKKNFSDFEIFKIFKNSRRLLYFLIDEQIIIIDHKILSLFFQNFHQSTKKLNKYIYLFPEKAVELGYITKKEENFDEKRRNGQNGNGLCQIIREDNIDEFITYVNKHDYMLTSAIPQSIFETNSFLINQKRTTLIEYAVFFGSTQIFKYLYKNNVKLTPSLWLYAIHGNDPEIIQILEDKKILPSDETYKECFRESIKCHHNDLVYYIESNLLKEKEEKPFENNVQSFSFRYYNFIYFPTKIRDNFILNFACLYDHYKIVEDFIKNKKIDLNNENIFYF